MQAWYLSACKASDSRQWRSSQEEWGGAKLLHNCRTLLWISHSIHRESYALTLACWMHHDRIPSIPWWDFHACSSKWSWTAFGPPAGRGSALPVDIFKDGCGFERNSGFTCWSRTNNKDLVCNGTFASISNRDEGKYSWVPWNGD